jgi:WD40 repeat protein
MYPSPASASASAPSARSKGSARSNAARLFGYDIFISFALGAPPRGSRSYASDLARRLRERDYTVFFSEDEAPAGDKLDDTLKTALTRSRILVVIANRGTLADPRWVRAEVEEFRGRHPERPIIPISIGGAVQDPALGPTVQQWLQFAGRIWIDDTQEACDQGIVSDDAIDRLVTAPTAVRASTRWRWTVSVAFGVLALVSVAALWFAWSDRQNAALAVRNEATAVANAATARANAELARDNATQAVASAAVAASEAARAQKAEGVAVHEAELARAAERRARAGQLAAESQLARSRDASLALLLAREAWATDRVPEARRALYEALFEPVRIVLGDGLGELRHVTYSSDGRFIAASGADARIHLWRVDAPGQPRVLQAGASVRALAFSPDGRDMASLDAQGRLQLWDPETGASRGEPVTAPGLRAGWAMAWRPDGQQLAVSGFGSDANEQRILLLDRPGWRVNAEPIRLSSNMGTFRVAWSPNGERLAATVSGQIHVWDLATRQLVVPPIPSRAATTFVVFTHDDRIVFDGPGYEATAWTLWNNVAEKPTYAGHSNWVGAFAHARLAGLVATGSEDGAIRLWRVDHATQVGGTMRHRWGVEDLAFSPDGRELVSVARDGQVVRWLLASDAHRHRKAKPTADSVPAGPPGTDVTRSDDMRWTVNLLPDKKQLRWYGPGGVSTGSSAPGNAYEGLAVARDGTLALRYFHDRLSLHAPGQAAPRCAIDNDVRFVRFSPDAAILLTWSTEDPTLRLWTAAECKPVAAIERRSKDAAFLAVDFATDSRTLWIADATAVRAWDVRQRKFAPGPGLAVPQAREIAVDPLGRMLAVGLTDLGIRLFDLQRGTTPVDLLGQGTGTLRALAVSRDGQWLASATDYGHALWDLNTGQLAGSPIANRQGQLRQVTFSSDGLTLVTRSTDPPDQRWELDADAWAARACEAARRNLTCGEWRRLMGPTLPWRQSCPQWPPPPDARDCGDR